MIRADGSNVRISQRPFSIPAEERACHRLDRLLGYGSRDVVGNNISMLFPPDRLAEEEALVQQTLSGHNTTRVETMWRHKDGSEIPISLSATSVRSGENQVAGILFTARDIAAQTKEARLEAGLAHVSRLSAMGEM